jgi:acetyltransferase-like isoleucine patch superfamily enzyme
MRLLEWYYRRRGQEPPYYAKYSLGMILWKPIRKFLNVVIIPNTPVNRLRIALYRMIGFQIGKKVFIGMKCYLDDLEPRKTIIEEGVIISYGCYFALHGRRQSRHSIHLEKKVYIGMRCNLVANKGPLQIGEGSIIGAGSLVNRSIPAASIAAGVPAKVIRPVDEKRKPPKRSS